MILLFRMRSKSNPILRLLSLFFFEPFIVAFEVINNETVGLIFWDILVVDIF